MEFRGKSIVVFGQSIYIHCLNCQKAFILVYYLHRFPTNFMFAVVFRDFCKVTLMCVRKRAIKAKIIIIINFICFWIYWSLLMRLEVVAVRVRGFGPMMRRSDCHN